MSWAYTSGTRCLVARNTVMLRRVSMTTCCSPPPRSSRGNILQHVSSMLMMRLRLVMPASFSAHSIFCWHSSRSVVASGHSFPNSPLGFLKEYPSDRMNRRVWCLEEAVANVTKCLQVRVQEFCQDSRSTAHTAADRRGTRCLPGQDSCGFQGARAAKSGTGSLLREPFAAGVAMRSDCAMVQLGLTRAREQNHSFTSSGMCVLRRFVQGSAGLSSPAPSPAVAGSSPAGSAATLAMPFSTATLSATAAIAMSSCTATCSATSAIVSCIGCPRCHHAGGSGPSSSTLRSMASMRRSRHSARLEGLPHDVPRNLAMGAGDVPSVHGATRDWHPSPVEHSAVLQHQRRTL